MQIHRSRHTSGFTVLPNTLLQDRRLSYTARGLLSDLISRPDGWTEDGRRMADTSPQGRLAVANALRELAAFGYYLVDKIRRDDGTFVTETHVYDTPHYVSPQVAPDLTRPGPGQRAAGHAGANPVKNRGKEPTLPAQRSAEPEPPGGAASEEAGREETPAIASGQDRQGGGPLGEVLGAAVTTLYRVIRQEPRLRVGMVEAMALAPLVTPWLDRGYGQEDLAAALLDGLPARVHSAQALLADRLTRKLPPPPEPATPAKPRWTECDTCARPTPHEGLCRQCAGHTETPAEQQEAWAQVAAEGSARVRAAMQAHRRQPALSNA